MKFSVKKIILIIVGIGVLSGGYLFSKFYFPDVKNLNSIYLIPKNVAYFISSDQPVKNWKKVRDSELWQHLQTNDYFAELSENINTFDSILNKNEKIFDLLGSKKLMISIHPISKYQYDYFFVIDLKKTAKFLQFQSILKSLLSDNYVFSQRNYKGVEIIELFDKKTRETLSMAVINNNLIASYTHSLVEASINQLDEPIVGRDLKFIEINQKVKENKLFQLYIQYDYVDDFVYILSKYSDKWLHNLSTTLVYSGFDLDLIAGNKVVAKGFTNLNDSTRTYLEALQNSGVGKHVIAKVAPHRTSMYFSLSFDNFNRFYDNYEKILQEDPETFNTIKTNQKKIEDLLNINIKKNFVSWMDDEIALLKLEPVSQVSHDNFALVFKANDIDKATENLNYIIKQIKKKTPVKFKGIDYKGYPIKFMSIKGFFKMFLGGYFNKLETPYYTTIDDFVVFSNHPNTLKYIITNFEEKNTLLDAANYKNFVTNFESKSNLFVYINTPMIYNTIIEKVGNSAKKDLIKNKQYFTSFSQIGIQLMPKDDILKSTVIIQYKDQESINFSDEFKAPTVSQENAGFSETKPIVVREIDEMQALTINPENLNATVYSRKYPNGQLQVTVPLKNGRKDGVYKEYYKNGKLRLKGRFKNDKKTGTWRKYDINGKLVIKKKY